jgi:hypothetical protein
MLLIESRRHEGKINRRKSMRNPESDIQLNLLLYATIHKEIFLTILLQLLWDS